MVLFRACKMSSLSYKPSLSSLKLFSEAIIEYRRLVL